MYSIGVDIGGSHITACMYEHTKKQLARETLVYKKINTKASKDEILSGWVTVISESMKRSGRMIEGIGIAMPGPFDYAEGISVISGVDKLQSLYGVNIRKELADGLGVASSKVRFINDATAFSVAESIIGEASTYQRVVAITLGTGFGSSFLVRGQPLISAPHVPEGGFLYDKVFEGKVADDVFSTRGILHHFEQINGTSVRNVLDLCADAHRNKKVGEVFNWFGTELGRFLKPYLTEFKAEVLVLGGNISKAHPFFMEALSGQLPGIPIYVSELGEEASVIGGALLLEDDFYQKLIPTLKLM